jgi:RHS repeat-associated protein
LTVSKTYDNRYQISRIQAGSVADYLYVRDAAGNITSSTGSEIPLITTADAGNTGYSYTANRLVSTERRSYVYDSDGNILSDGIRTFVYNQDNRLVRVSISGVVVGEYAYDAFGRRVKKVASGKTVLYHYAGGNLIAETDENGVTLRDYIYFNGEPVALRIYGAQFGTMYYFVNDHLGTPQKILDSSAQVVWAAAYLPFGKAQVKPEIITNNLRFPGQYFDAESGLHYNWHRFYDSDTGRYSVSRFIRQHIRNARTDLCNHFL